MTPRAHRATVIGRLLLLAVFLFASLAEPVRAHANFTTASPSRRELRLGSETRCQSESAYPAIFAPRDQTNIGFVASANPINGTDPSGNVFTTIETLAVNLGNGIKDNFNGIRGHYIKQKIKEQIRELLEDKAIEGIYVIVIEPQLGVLVPYVGQGRDLYERLPQSAKERMAGLRDDAIRFIDYLPIDTNGVKGQRAKKFVRETAEQYLINLLRVDLINRCISTCIYVLCSIESILQVEE